MVLERFKKDSIDNIDGFIGGRVPKQMEKDFKAVCKANNMTVAEALRILITEELNGFSDQRAAAPVAPAPMPGVSNESYIREQETTKPIIKPYSVPETGPIAVKDFVLINGKGSKEIPCPICNKWYAYPNYGRHIKQHTDKNTLDFLLEYKYMALQMIKEKAPE